MNDEEWRPILGSHAKYEVSTLGRVRRTNGSGRILTGIDDGKGYRRVRMLAHGRLKLWFIHQLVGWAFLGDCPVGQQINHIDSNRSNNRLDNLEYVTPQANQRHSWTTTNRQPPHRGESTHFAKLTEDDVRAIRLLRQNSELSYAQIASRFNTKAANVWFICSGRTWKHLL